jgi:hypothetical protein
MAQEQIMDVNALNAAPKTRSEGHPTWLDDAVFWIIPALTAMVMFQHPFTFADLGWQLKLGELMASNGSPFIREQFAATHVGEPIIPNAWLAQIVYAQIQVMSGWYGLRAFDALLWISGPLVAVIPARLRGDRPFAITYALIAGLAVAMPSASIRPQSFASLAFALMLVLIQCNLSWRKSLAIGLPLFLIWQNLHPSVPVAALIIGLIAAVQWARHFAGMADRPVTVTMLAIAAGIAVIATPAGPAIIEFAKYNAVASVSFGATEWLPLWNPYNFNFLWLVTISIAVVLFVAAKERENLSVNEIVPVIVTFAMALTAERFILFYAISIIPVLARLKIGNVNGHSTGLRSIIVGYAVSAVMITLVSLFMPFQPEEDNAKKVVATLAAELDKNNVNRGTIFSDPTLGGGIIYFGNRDWKVSFDGRFYLYSPKEVALLQRAYFDRSVISDLDKLYRPVAYALNASRSKALVEELAARPETWRRIYDNGHSVVFIKAPALAPRQARSPTDHHKAQACRHLNALLPLAFDSLPA